MADILSPARAASPYHDRFLRYFGKGNSLFSVLFDEAVPPDRLDAFVDSLLLFRIAESWGGHVSLVLPVHPPHRKPESLPKGRLLRFHAGLEEVGDLIEDLRQASRGAALVDP
ncbi:PLP-dependent transferase [Enterovirga rhinocerotis]|uniref:PLP-dependent transferase n=1 Tax=Enterovirga rhinocerotis TaxID=1339210 RepID=UPI001414FE4C|nr:PLP-dependent transferase [Enterovirga rhinocerotis]